MRESEERRPGVAKASGGGGDGGGDVGVAVPEAVQAAASGGAYTVIGALVQSRERPCRYVHVIEGEGWRVRVCVEPAAGSGFNLLTPCGKDIVKVLEGRDEYLTGSAVMGELNRRGWLHGEATVRATLARLVRDGVLEKHAKAPRGYRLAAECDDDGDDA